MKSLGLRCSHVIPGTLIEQLAALCGSNVLGEKIVIAPSLAIGHQIGDALAQSGTSWVNLRFESIRTLVDAVIGFDIAEKGLRVASRAQALALLESACDRALAPDSYFTELADRPGLHRAIQRSLDDLRLAGAHLGGIDVSAFEDRRKAKDLAAILSAYETAMTSERYLDSAAVLLRAVRKLEGGAASPWPGNTTWILLDEVELSSEEEGFLSLASEGRLVRLKTDAKGFMLEPENVRFIRAAGEENEIRAAFRALLSGNHPFDSAEIIYSRREAYLPLVYELAAEHAIPCTFAEGIAAPYTTPGQACLAFLRWVGSDWDARVLQQAAKGGALILPETLDENGGAKRLSPTAFSRVLRNAAIGWGRERYLTRLDAWMKERTLALTDVVQNRDQTERDLREAASTRTFCSQLLSSSALLVTDENPRDLDTTALANACVSFLGKFVAVRSEIDGMAQSGLRRLFEELADLPSNIVPRLEATERLADAVRHLHVSASNPRPGHLHVAPLRAGGWSGRPIAFITGLDDTKYPGAGLQDPILLDSERGAINRLIGPRHLQMRGEAPQRMTAAFEQLLQRLEKARRLFISFPMLDLVEGRELYPASAVLEVFRRVHARSEATFEDVVDSAGKVSGFVDQTVQLSAAEWWLARAADGVVPAAAVHDAYPMLRGGAEAMAARESNELTRWDGMISAPPEEVDPRSTGRIYSASQLEKMASCPIGYFFERHLHIRPLDELQRDPDIWLNAMNFGTLFHRVAERFMKEICVGEATPSARHRERLDEIADEELQSWRELVPPPNEGAFSRRRDDLADTLEIFLQGEIDCGSTRGKYFEARFGFTAEAGDGIAMPDPLLLNLGNGRSIAVRGSIDRVDYDEASGLWNIWDYKTGSKFQYMSNDRLARGTKIQHAIYAKALCAMLQRRGVVAKVGASGYYFPTPKARGFRQARACDEGELEYALNLLFDVVGAGFFPHVPVDVCKFCDYEAVSGNRTTAAAQMTRKFAANAAHPAVKAWLALQEIR